MARRNHKYTQAQIDGALDRVRRGYTVAEAARLSGVNRARIYRELSAQAEKDSQE